MKKELVEVVFDRRKNSEKRGYGFLEVQVYLGRATRKYIMIGKYSPDDWQAAAASPETQALVAKCKKTIAAMDVLDEERTYDNFMYHFNGEEKKPKVEVKEEKSKEPEKSETLWRNLSPMKICAKAHASTRYVLSKPCAHSVNSTPMAT